MIRHIVFWKMKENAEGASGQENAQKMVEKFFSLKGQIEGLVSIEAGVDFNKSDAAYDIALVTTFNTVEDLNFYQTHPKHVAIVEFVRKVVEDRRVVDYVTE